ncbi:MAG TPA: C-terminal binding protein [Pedobacter sp.]|jgi:D-3-phosphoglycerate dehydrogenase
MEKILITDYGFKNIDQESSLLQSSGYLIETAQCTTPEEIIEKGADSVGLLVQWAPVTRKVIEQLKNCRVIVRYGIGVDNVDLQAAKERGIKVCNVPDYCIEEVADHTISLALSLARQLTITQERMKKGIWKITPPQSMPAFKDMIFSTIGYGRIAREVLNRANVFGFSKAAFDPNVDVATMKKSQVRKLSFDELIEQSDIISLHLPLNGETHHIINEKTLSRMKAGAILVNTSRGGLIDTEALAKVLQSGKLFAGLDVFEEEPLPVNHPLYQCENAVLTSHTAWYSERSVPTLQRMAAEELVRGLKGSMVKNRVV